MIHNCTCEHNFQIFFGPKCGLCRAVIQNYKIASDALIQIQTQMQMQPLQENLSNEITVTH